MILVICNVFFDCLSSDKFTAPQHLVLALHELHGAGLLEMGGHFLSRNATTATSRAVEGKVLTDCEVGCSNILVGALELAVRAMVVAQGTIFVKVAKKMLALHFGEGDSHVHAHACMCMHVQDTSIHSCFESSACAGPQQRWTLLKAGPFNLKVLSTANFSQSEFKASCLATPFHCHCITLHKTYIMHTINSETEQTSPNGRHTYIIQ